MEAAAFQLIAAGFEQEALEVADRAVELFPNRFAAHNARGWAAQALGEFAEAQASLERALAVEPIAMAHNNLGGSSSRSAKPTLPSLVSIARWSSIRTTRTRPATGRSPYSCSDGVRTLRALGGFKTPYCSRSTSRH